MDIETDNNLFPNQKNDYYKKFIRTYENPNPIVIAIMVILFIVLSIIIYNVVMKVNLSNNWYSLKDKKEYYIKHDVWNDKIISNKYGSGYIRGEIINCYNNEKICKGIIEKGFIYWTNGDIWKQVIYI